MQYKRKLAVGAVAAALAIATPLIVTGGAHAASKGASTAPAAERVPFTTCVAKRKTVRDSRRMSGYAYDHYFYVRVTAKYWVCTPQGARKYTKPIYTRIRYNRSGKHQFCKRYNHIGPTFKEFRANALMTDRHARTFNPGAFAAGCRKDTAHLATQYYPVDVKKMYWLGNYAPLFTANWSLRFHGDWSPVAYGGTQFRMK